MKQLVGIANEADKNVNARPSLQQLSSTAITSVDMVKATDAKAPSGTVDAWIQQEYEGVEKYLRNNDIRTRKIFFMLSPDVRRINGDLNEDNLPILMCVADENGKYKDPRGKKYQLVGFLPYGNQETNKNQDAISQIRKLAFARYQKGLTDGYTHLIADENGKELKSDYERMEIDKPLNGHYGNRVVKFGVRDVLKKLSGSKTVNDERFKELVKRVISRLSRIPLNKNHYMLGYRPTSEESYVYMFVKKVSQTVNSSGKTLVEVIEAVKKDSFYSSALREFNSQTRGIYSVLIGKQSEIQNIYGDGDISDEQKDLKAEKYLNEKLKNYVNIPEGWSFGVNRIGNIVHFTLQASEAIRQSSSFEGLIDLMSFDSNDITQIDDDNVNRFMVNLFTETTDNGQIRIRQANPQERKIDIFANQNDFIVWQINYNEAEQDSEMAANRLINYLSDDLLEMNQDFLDEQIHGISVSSPFSDQNAKFEQKDPNDSSSVQENRNLEAVQKNVNNAMNRLRALRRGAMLNANQDGYEDLNG